MTQKPPATISADLVEQCPINAITQVDGGYVLRIEVDDLQNREIANSEYVAWDAHIKLASFYPKIGDRVLEPTISWIRITQHRGQAINSYMASELQPIDMGDFEDDYLQHIHADKQGRWTLNLIKTPYAVGFLDFFEDETVYMNKGNFEVKIVISEKNTRLPRLYMGRTEEEFFNIKSCDSFGIITNPAPNLRQIEPAYYSIIGGEDNTPPFIRDPYAWTHWHIGRMPEDIKKAYPASWLIPPPYLC